MVKKRLGKWGTVRAACHIRTFFFLFITVFPVLSVFPIIFCYNQSSKEDWCFFNTVNTGAPRELHREYWNGGCRGGGRRVIFIWIPFPPSGENLVCVSAEGASSPCRVISCYRVISHYVPQSLMGPNCFLSHPNSFSNSKSCWVFHRKREKVTNFRCVSQHFYRKLSGPVGKYMLHTSLKFHCKSQTLYYCPVLENGPSRWILKQIANSVCFHFPSHGRNTFPCAAFFLHQGVFCVHTDRLN